MSVRDIDGLLLALKEAVITDNEELTKEAVIGLLGGFLKDVSRIADALELIATPSVGVSL